MKRKTFLIALAAMVSSFWFMSYAQIGDKPYETLTANTDNTTTCVAKVGDEYYTSVSEAINAAGDGATVQLLPCTIDEAIAPWIGDSQHKLEKSITIVGAENFGTILTGGLFLGYNDGTVRNNTITVKGINFKGKGILVANQKTVVIEGNQFTNITEKVSEKHGNSNSAILVLGTSNDMSIDATIKNNKINDVTNVGIYLSQVGAVLVEGNTVTSTQHNAITISAATTAIVGVNSNTLSQWGKGGEGRAMRISGAATVNAKSNVMTYEGSAPEEFVKITGATSIDASENYWNGADPSTNGIFLGIEGNIAEQLKNYYTDTEKKNLVEVKENLTGEGTEANPYLIKNVSQLVDFRNSVNAGEKKYNAEGAYVALGADIDLAEIENWEPIGTFDYSFDSNFDGKGYAIKNLKMTDNTAANDYAYLGFFGITANNVIKNVVIENVSIASEGQIVSAAIGYPYYTTVSDITVKGDIAIKGGNYTAGVLGYTRLCQNASNLVVAGNEGSYITGAKVVGGVIADIQMNHGLVANYSNFSVSGVSVTGTQMVGGISGIICEQTLNGASVNNVTLTSDDSRVGIVSGSLGGVSTIINATYDNVVGTIAIVGATYNDGAAVEAKIGDKYYRTLNEALSAEGDVIELLTPIVVAKDETRVLDLKGKTVKHLKECTASYQMIDNKGNLTISNGVISFTDTSAGDPTFGWGSYTIRNEGTLIVNNATIEHLGTQNPGNGQPNVHMYCAIFQYCGSTTINGGKISTPTYRSARLWKGDMTINGGVFEGQLWVQPVDNTSELEINGGTFAPCGNDGSSVFVENSNYEVSFAVNDGTFATKIGCSDATKLAGCIKGGKFSEAAINATNSALIAQGYVFGEADENGYKTLANDNASYYISNIDELKSFRDLVNAGDGFEGMTVYLTSDIDMSGIDWSVNIGDDCSATFDGVFDGQNHKIKNLTSTETSQKSDGYICTGLFGAIAGDAVIKNLTIENVSINTGDYTGNNVAAVVGFAYSAKGSIENVNVVGDININAKDVTGVGAIVGYDYYSPSLKLVNCTVQGNDGSAIIGAAYVGGLVGYASKSITINNNVVENVSVNATGSAGAVAGIMLGGSSVASGNTVKNVVLTTTGELWKNSAAVVAGTITSGAVTISNTTVENVTANGIAADIVGGILVEKPTTAIAKVQAKIGDKYYTTLDAALLAEGDEIELLTPIVIAKDETRLLDLKGKTLTGVDNNVKGNFYLFDNRGTLTITGNGKITLSATNNREFSASSVVVANNPGGKLVVENATIEHLGGTDMAYAIDNLTNGKGTYSETIINDGLIKSTYRAVRQFLNGIESQNILTINAGVIEGGNKSLFFHDPSKNANSGSLTVSDNVSLKGDVYLFVTDGSTEWPVEVSIADAALKNGSTVMSKNVPVGYGVLNKNGVWSVYDNYMNEMTIVDAEYNGKEFVNNSDITVGKLTYTRTLVGENTWNALYLPFEIPMTAEFIQNYDVAYFNDIHSYDEDRNGEIDRLDMEVLYIQEGQTLNANYPYLIRAKNADAKNLVIEVEDAILYKTEETSISCTSVFMKFQVTGVYNAQTAAQLKGEFNVYGMSSDGVWRPAMSDDQVLNPFRLYLSLATIKGSPVKVSSNAMRAIRISADGDGTTAIEKTQTSEEITIVYDLMGRRVMDPQEGEIYIINGKKVLF